MSVERFEQLRQREEQLSSEITTASALRNDWDAKVKQLQQERLNIQDECIKLLTEQLKESSK